MIGGLPIASAPIAGADVVDTTSGEVTRAPLYVTASWKNWSAPDLAVNVAVLAAIVAVPLSRPQAEPTIAKRPAPQVELAPNLAVRSAAAPPAQNSYVEPTFTRKATQQPEVSPNLAVRQAAAVARPVPAPIEPVIWPRPQLVIDLFTNVARLGTESIPIKREPLYTQYPKAKPPAVDLSPNLAVSVVGEAVMLITDSNDLPQGKWERSSQDVFPNLAVRGAVVAQPARPLVEPQTRRTPWTQTEHYRNQAAYFVATPVPIVMPVEPWINKRFPPQVDVYQNQTINAPADSARGIPAPIEPTKYPGWTVEGLAVLPNIAVNLAEEIPVAEPTKLGGDDKLRRSHHRGYGTKRALLKRDEEQRQLAEIRAIYRELMGFAPIAQQAEQVLAPIQPEGETEQAYTEYQAQKSAIIEQRLETLSALGVESEIALRILYKELQEMRERDDEEVIQSLLAQLL